MTSFRRAVLMGGAVAMVLGGVAVARAAADARADEVPRVRIEATSAGFKPDTVRLVAGAPADLVFTRTTTSGCVAQVHIPGFGIGRTALPQNEPVVIRVQPKEPGVHEFLCGMDMHRGTIIVTAAPRRRG